MQSSSYEISILNLYIYDLFVIYLFICFVYETREKDLIRTDFYLGIFL